MDISIDKFSPCLENAKTGEIIETFFSKADFTELKSLQKKGWNFNWTSKQLNNCEIYKLNITGDRQIHGLVAIQDFPKDKAVYVNIAESAPHNLGKSKQYNGVGGHLFAIAAKRSIDLGYDGFLFMDAKNMKLVEHYKKSLGAAFIGMPHQYRMAIDEKAAKKLIEKYTLQEG
jgi:hypothetical protein